MFVVTNPEAVIVTSPVELMSAEEIMLCNYLHECPCGEVFIQTDSLQWFCSPRFGKKRMHALSISRSKNIAHVEA